MPDHGGNLDRAIAIYGGERKDWIDLSTGINPVPYPLSDLPPHTLTALPTAAEMAALAHVAANAYGTGGIAVPLAGAQAAIQILPFLADTPGRAKILAPTYGEYAPLLENAGWTVTAAASPGALAGADLAIVVNPNNPDGRRHAPDDLLALASNVGLLVVDESFTDAEPELSLASAIAPETQNLIVLRSFGKFFGLAGLRLGFALAGEARAQRLQRMSGPWPVNGPAIAIAGKALADDVWKTATIARLERDAERLDTLTRRAGWKGVGGTTLFRTFATPDAAAAQERLARARIWTRIFSYEPTWIRLGLPGHAEHWSRLEAALTGD